MSTFMTYRKFVVGNHPNVDTVLHEGKCILYKLDECDNASISNTYKCGCRIESDVRNTICEDAWVEYTWSYKTYSYYICCKHYTSFARDNDVDISNKSRKRKYVDI